MLFSKMREQPDEFVDIRDRMVGFVADSIVIGMCILTFVKYIPVVYHALRTIVRTCI